MMNSRRRLVAGVIDYGVGNVASVCRALNALGIRSKVSREPYMLDRVDFLVLPGVGAFSYAMAALSRYELCEYIKKQAAIGKPILGICLGMQLLADESEELHITAGIGLIPGRVIELDSSKVHVGWNTIDVLNTDYSPITSCDSEVVYFNHVYTFETAEKYQLATTQMTQSSRPLVSAVKKDNIIGLQFHPEKSQSAGRRILSATIKDLCNA